VFRERVETFGLSDIQETRHPPFTLMKYYTGMEVCVCWMCKQRGWKMFIRRAAGGPIAESSHPRKPRYKVLTLTAILNAAENISLALTIVADLIAFIALVISGIGIMNICW